jgi:phage-related tail fiber protein
LYPVGCLIWVPSPTPPNGFIKANGSVLSRSTYAALWTYAQNSENIAVSDAARQDGQFSPGDGSTTFRIPDLRGNFVRGFDDSRGIDAGRVFGTTEFPSVLAAEQLNSITVQGVSTSVSGSDPNFLPSVSFDTVSATDYTLGAITRVASTMDGGQCGFTLIGGARPRNVALLACIKY